MSDKKRAIDIVAVWQSYSAKRRRTLSWLGFGPVADWGIAVLIAFIIICGALYSGWNMYAAESRKEFVPQPQAFQSQGLRRQVANAIEFFERRTAATSEVNSESVETGAPIPSQNASDDEGDIPSIR